MIAETLSAVLWDMDGTLVDSEPLWLEAELAMLERYGLTMSDATHDMLIGTGLWDGAELFRALGVPLSADEIVNEWVASVSRDLASKPLQWRPGAVELLGSLREAGIPCALVTMSVRSLADAVVAKLPQNTFQAIVAGDEVTHEKPHPEPFLLGAEALGVDIHRCMAFEDSPTGLRSAHASGAVAVGIPNLLPLEGLPSHAVLESLAELNADAMKSMFSKLRAHNLTRIPQELTQETTP